MLSNSVHALYGNTGNFYAKSKNLKIHNQYCLNWSYRQLGGNLNLGFGWLILDTS